MSAYSLSLVASAVVTLSPVSAPSPTSSISTVPHVFEAKSVSQIPIDQKGPILFLYDIDDTLFDFPNMLGSQAWRRYIAREAKKIDSSENWHDKFTLMLAQKAAVVPVEGNKTTQFIDEVNNRGHIQAGLTSRQRDVWYNTPQQGVDDLTAKQLLSASITFSNNHLENVYPQLSTAPEYANGIFFVDTKLKGDYLIKLLKDAPELPEKVVFVDDKLDQAESVAKALNQLGIPCECYFYTATAEKTEAFDPLIANIELYYFCKSDGNEVISDQEARSIAKENPDKDAEYYLRAALAIAKNQKS